MAGGTLDAIVARIESYLGEFLQTRQQLLDAKSRIESALSQAQNTGSAKIGEKTFTYAQLSSLATENEELLSRNADLQNQISNFKDQVTMVSETASSVMDTLVATDDPDYPWYDMPGLTGGVGSGGMGALPGVVVPAAYLVGVGAVLAGAVYLFMSNVKTHLGNVAGDVGSNFLIYGGIALLGYWYAKKQRWI
jgi:cell division protein FtsB